MITGALCVVAAATVAGEVAFEQSIAHLPEDQKQHQRQQRREWQAARNRQAEEAAMAKQSDSALALVLGVVLGVVVS